MKIEITENKVFMAGKEGEKDQPVPKGTILNVDKFPGHLVGKARIVEESAGKKLVTGEDELKKLQAEYKALAKKEAPKDLDADGLKAAIAELSKK